MCTCARKCGRHGGHEEYAREERDEPRRAVDRTRDERAEREQDGVQRGEHELGFSGEPDVRPVLDQILGDPRVLDALRWQCPLLRIGVHGLELMIDLVAFVNRTDLPPVVQAAVAHAQFETIHPFASNTEP